MRRLLEFVPRAAFSGLHRSAANAGLQQSYRVEILDPLAIADTSLFRPGTLWRHKGSMLQMASEHTLHMQESFSQMSLEIHHVLSDFTGTCGQAILDAILAGQRDPIQMAQLCNVRVKSPRERVAQTLVGDYRPEHLFTLGQSLEGYRYYQKLIADLNCEILRLMQALPGAAEHPAPMSKRTKSFIMS